MLVTLRVRISIVRSTFLRGVVHELRGVSSGERRVNSAVPGAMSALQSILAPRVFSPHSLPRDLGWKFAKLSPARRGWGRGKSPTSQTNSGRGKITYLALLCVLRLFHQTGAF